MTERQRNKELMKGHMIAGCTTRRTWMCGTECVHCMEEETK